MRLPRRRRAGGRRAVLLEGGTANRGRVFRVGDTVRRPLRPTSAATAALLQHLADGGFPGAPRPLGVDRRGREVLSYVPGQVVVPPYPAWALTDAALDSVARLLRGYHEAVVGFDSSPYRWPASPPSPFDSGLVAHNDPNLDNVVFRDGQAVALIDFDLASPASPLWDVAAAARLWAPLRPDSVVDDARRGGVLRRFRRFVDAYGVAEQDRGQVVDAVRSNHDWSYSIVRRGAETPGSGFADYWTPAAAARADTVRRWYDEEDGRLRAALG